MKSNKSSFDIGEHVAKSLLGDKANTKKIHVIFNSKFKYDISCDIIETIFISLGLDFLSVSITTHDLTFHVIDTPFIDSHCILELNHDFKSVEEFYAHLHKALEDHIQKMRNKTT